MFRRSPLSIAALGALLAWAAAPALAQELRVQCYSDGNECEVTGEIAKRFEAANAGAKIVIDKVPYKAVVETLPVQLAAGEGPDIARVTDLGGLNKYYLDLTPHLAPRAPKAWNDNFASTLPWFRAGPADKGIYGLMSQLTVTGAFVNKTLFEQAKVPMPGDKATWDDWMAAADKVAKATKTPFAMAMDRSGHRFAPLAVAYGAKIFDAKGAPVIDAGYQTAVKKFVDWNKAGLMPKEVWGGVGGSQYRDAFEEFANGRVVMYYSGSWQLKRMDTAGHQGLRLGRGARALRPGGLHRDARRRRVRRAQAHQAAGAGRQVPRLPGRRRELQGADGQDREHSGQPLGGQGRRHLQRLAGGQGRAELLRRRRAEDRASPTSSCRAIASTARSSSRRRSAWARRWPAK